LDLAPPGRSGDSGSGRKEERERAMKIQLTFWRVVFLVIMVLGIYSTYVRYLHGLGAVSNMTDQFPWGFWIGFDCLCGVMLAAGGFCMVGAVYLFNVESLHSVVRPAVLTAFLGYLLFIVGLLFDLGRPWFIWHQLIYMNPHSVMFEVGFCVMTYTTVLFFEFLPNVFERLSWKTPIKWIHGIYPVLIVLGILLSTLHQSSLGSLYLIMPSKLHPFWYSPALPFFFFGSAVAVGLAMTIFESTQSAKALGRHLELSVLVRLGGALLIALWVNALLRFEDYFHRGLLRQIFRPSYEAYFLWLELALSFVIPIALLSFKKVRLSSNGLYLASVISLFGFITNRLNVSLIGFETYVGHHYMPKWTEFSVTLMIIAMGFALFRVAVQYLPIFPKDDRVPVSPTVRAAIPLASPVLEHAGD
jgi:Ni/Fe-hydrogenase subunit HybB-like protein